MFKKNVSLKQIHTYFILALALTCFVFFSAAASGMAYIPSKPLGPEMGVTDEEYSFQIASSEPGSRWIFNWGDGTFSEWITFNSSSYYKIQRHSYNSPGIYQIKVKYKNIYDEESRWSEPLNITIYAPGDDFSFDFFADSDDDGWSNIFEQFCGTDMYNSMSFPKDTDNDGLPDETQNSNFTADADDDNDGLEDKIELKIGSNPKDESDVRIAEYENNTYFLVDTDNDGKIDKFYVKYQGETTKPLDYDEGENLIDSLNKKINRETKPKVKDKKSTTFLLNFSFLWIIIVVFFVIFIIVILFKTGILFFYEEEVEE